MDPRRLLEQFLGPQAAQTVGGMLGDFARPAGGAPARRDPPAQGDPWGARPRTSSPLDAIGGALGGLGAGGLGAGGLAAGGLLAVLLGSKKARKLAGGALGYGAAAVVGALAHRAYRNWEQGRRPSSAPIDVTPAPRALESPGRDGAPFALSLILAMIAAANADGHVDAAEQKAIFEAVDRAGLAGDEKAFVLDALRSPPGAREIAARAASTEQASQLWLAARIAIDPDHPAERAWLDDLAQAAGLPADLVAHLESQITTG